MLIKLKQSEIEEALRDFIVKQGFNLDRKTVDISFTAGRGDSGMTADLDIHDAAAVMGSAQCSPVYETQASTSGSVGGVEEATPAPQLHVVETSPAAEDFCLSLRKKKSLSFRRPASSEAKAASHESP